MDLGRDVITRTLIGSTEAEKVFTPWWITMHHYLVYSLVVLGLIAVPINSMMSVNGNCSYKFSSPHNYVLPHGICKIKFSEREGGETLVFERRHCPDLLREKLNLTLVYAGVTHEHYSLGAPHPQFLSRLKNIEAENVADAVTNFRGCKIKRNPRLFPFHVYWNCVNRLSPIALYFPYLVLTLATILVLLERILTRYMWTGQRIEKLYDLLIKDVLASGDIDAVDTKENRQRCRQIHYDFKGSWFYCKAYITQTALKLSICLGVLIWSLFDQCNSLRESFHTTFECKVFEYMHECSIPSNGMNLAIFDLCNIVLFLVVAVATFNMAWHFRFKRNYVSTFSDNNDWHEADKTGDFTRKLKLKLQNFKQWWYKMRTTQLGRLVDTYFENLLKRNPLTAHSDETKILQEVYIQSPDMQMLLNLLTEKEGIWSALIVLSLFDKNFKNEFKVRDSQITSNPSPTSSRRRDVTIAWNEPRAAQFLGHNVPTEHLMYVLEIDPPIDKNEEDGIVMMPACTNDGGCVFTPVRKESKLDVNQNHIPLSQKGSNASTLATNSRKPSSLSRQSSLSSLASSPDKAITIVDGGIPEGLIEKKKSSLLGSIRASGAHLNLRRKTALLLGRKRSAGKVRNFKSTLRGLRSDTEYVLKISFVLSGRKLGSESYRILCNDAPCRKSSTNSIETSGTTPKSSLASDMMGLSLKRALAAHQEPAPSEPENDHIMTATSSQEAKLLLRGSSEKSQGSLGDERLVLLELFATWCGLCKNVAPMVDDLASNFGGRYHTATSGKKRHVTFIRADVEDCTELAEEYDVQVLPTFILIEQRLQLSKDTNETQYDGKIKSVHIGQQVKNLGDEIESWFKEEPINADAGLHPNNDEH